MSRDDHYEGPSDSLAGHHPPPAERAYCEECRQLWPCPGYLRQPANLPTGAAHQNMAAQLGAAHIEWHSPHCTGQCEVMRFASTFLALWRPAS